MPVVRIETIDDPRLVDFRDVPDPVLLRERNLFVAEGRFVIETLLRTDRFHVRALLLTESTHRHLADDLVSVDRDVPIYIVEPPHFRIGGYDFHRGYLAIADRPEPVDATVLIEEVATDLPLVVLERIGNPDNIGGIFRNAAALGAAAVLLSPGCCDPLYRKAIRTAMGTTLRVPFAIADDWPSVLQRLRVSGYMVVALTPSDDATDVGAFVEKQNGATRVALLLGTESSGLSAEALALADERVRIAIDQSVDSLNVATATGIALHALRRA